MGIFFVVVTIGGDGEVVEFRCLVNVTFCSYGCVTIFVFADVPSHKIETFSVIKKNAEHYRSSLDIALGIIYCIHKCTLRIYCIFSSLVNVDVQFMRAHKIGVYVHMCPLKFIELNEIIIS